MSVSPSLIAVAVVTGSVFVVGCAQMSSPTAPAVAAPTYTVSGVVFDRTAGVTVPVEGIWVADAVSRRGVLTDRNGFYSIQGLAAGDISLTASGSHYYVAIVTLTISGDARKDIEIFEVNE